MKKHAGTAAVFGVLIALFGLAANDWKAPWARPPAHDPADRCKEHGVALSTCVKCKPEPARGGTFVVRDREPKEGECPNTVAKVTLGPKVAERMNIQFHTVDTQSVSETIRANAETMYPPAKYARVAPRIPGVIRQVKAILGQQVEAGDALAVIDAPEFGKAKAEYLQAIAVLNLRQKRYDQEAILAEKKISAARDLLQAETELKEATLAMQSAAQRLAALGLTPDEIRSLADKKDTSALMTMVAPFKGVVVEASAVPGEIATPERPVFSVADVERLWLRIDVYESDLAKIAKGQRVVFTVEGLQGARFSGKIVAVGAEVDERTRTVRVFADIKNTDGLLRTSMFGRARIIVKPSEPKLLVPKEAVQNDGDCNLVFVSPKPNVFQARKVQLGAKYGNGYEVVGGLAKGEKVVTTGSFLLKTEVMRGQLGAG